MATKVKRDEKNDWSSEDESWDKWDDAEDNSSPEVNEVKEVNEVTKVEEKNDAKAEEETKPKEIENQQINKSSSWWGGISTVLSTATEGLGNLSTTVSQGLNQVIGVPQPEELARINAATETPKRNRGKESDVQSSANDSGVTTRSGSLEEGEQSVFGLNLVSGVTTLGSKVLNTGLDTLEGIGKKTMNILQENDPLLKNKRKLLGLETDKPILSEILQEAKKESDEFESTLRELEREKAKAQLRFEVLFEKHCGLVHMEALEILSREYALKLQNKVEAKDDISCQQNMRDLMNDIESLMSVAEIEPESYEDYTVTDVNDYLLATIKDAEFPIHFEEIDKIWKETQDWIKTKATNADDEETFAHGIEALSHTCALQVCKLHKIAELILVKEYHNSAEEIEGVVQLCEAYSLHLQGLTRIYTTLLTEQDNEIAKNYTGILFAELGQATQQIRKAMKFLVPILEIGAV